MAKDKGIKDKSPKDNAAQDHGVKVNGVNDGGAKDIPAHDKERVATSKRLVSFVLDGHITAVEPIHISTPDKDSDDHEGVVIVPRMVLGNLVDLASVKGDTLKGLFRRVATELSADILVNRGNGTGGENPFSMTDYYRVAIGGVKGSEKQSPDDVFLLRKTAERNPVAYLFGNAEPYWMGGTVRFGFATAQQHEAWGRIPGGARRDPLLTDPELLASFTSEEQEAWRSYAETNSEASKDKKRIKDLNREIGKLWKQERTPDVIARHEGFRAEIKQIEADIKEKKSGEIIKDTIGRPLAGRNAILPGAVLDQKMDVMRLTFAQFGFFLKTLERLSEDPRIGGISSKGYGRFKANWTLTVQVTENGRRQARQVLGDVTIDHFKFGLPDHPLIAEALEAFDELAADPKVDFLFEERPKQSRQRKAPDDDADGEPMLDAAE